MRDVLWLREDEKLEKEDQLELKKHELQIERERTTLMFKILSDIRFIQISQMSFTSDLDFKDFLTKLPSYDGDAENQQREHRWKVKKRNPGEIPEWKKKRLAEVPDQDIK